MVFSKGFQTVTKSGQSQLTNCCRGHSQDLGLYAYQPMHRQVRLLLGLLVYCAGPCSFHEGTYVCGQMTSYCCCEVGGQKQGMSYFTKMLTPFSLRHLFIWLSNTSNNAAQYTKKSSTRTALLRKNIYIQIQILIQINLF